MEDSLIVEKAKQIKLLVLDVDGILTDGKIYYGNFGDEIKAFDVKDGFGTMLLRRAGIQTVLITAKKSKIIRLRAKDSGINQVYESPQKLKVFNKLVRKYRLKSDQACYMGDDLIDIPVLKNAGLSVTVPQAVREVKEAAGYVTKANAGSGAVRELCELILKSQNKWEEVTRKYLA